jgi:hypothetical protein
VSDCHRTPSFMLARVASTLLPACVPRPLEHRVCVLGDRTGPPSSHAPSTVLILRGVLVRIRIAPVEVHHEC